METDRIQKKILLHASPERIWRALADSTEFGSWFGMQFEGAFEAGKSIKGIIVPTAVNAEVARAQEPYRGIPLEMWIEQMQPGKLFSFRWHPGAVEKGIDYSKEPTTLVEFALEQVADGVLLTMTESGFDRLPLERRARAFSGNEKGWTMVMTLIEEHLAASK